MPSACWDPFEWQQSIKHASQFCVFSKIVSIAQITDEEMTDNCCGISPWGTCGSILKVQLTDFLRYMSFL